MKWIGLTGGIASGKSTTAKLFSQNGLPVIDADQIVHDLSRVGQRGYEQIVSMFGSMILLPDQTINRKALGEIIFNDVSAKTQLENLLHPLVQEEVLLQRMKHQDQGYKACVYDVPLLFEKKLEQQFDLIVLVYTPLMHQVERLMSRNQLSHLDALARLKSQIAINEKIQKSNFCIDNSTSREDLELQIHSLIKKLVG